MDIWEQLIVKFKKKNSSVLPFSSEYTELHDSCEKVNTWSRHVCEHYVKRLFSPSSIGNLNYFMKCAAGAASIQVHNRSLK